jgi:hypothetical protein
MAIQIPEIDTISLRDISSIAKTVGIAYPTFITAAFWNSVEIGRQECRVLLALEGVERHIAREPSMLRCGSFETCVAPALHARGWPRAACPWLLPFRVSVFASREHGGLVFLSDPEEVIDFRAGGTFYLM